MPRELFNSPYVFIRRDSHKPPLTPPYEGPYKVLQRGTKYFQIDVGGREEAISVDRLNPGPDGRCFHAAWAVSKSAH